MGGRGRSRFYFCRRGGGQCVNTRTKNNKISALSGSHLLHQFLFGTLVIVEKLPVLRRVTLKRSDPGSRGADSLRVSGLRCEEQAVEKVLN